MSYNGSGTFNINTTGQPVVAGTVISSSAFNSLTTDLATGLTTAITKDGQTTTTARITFAQGITSSLTTDSSSVSTGSIITGGGVGVAKNVYVGSAVQFVGSTSGSVGLQAKAVAGSTTFKLPSADGTSNQAMVTDGSGNLSFTTIGATPGGSTTQLQYNNAGAFGGISGVTTDGTRITASTTIGVGAATPSTSGAGITFPATQSASTNANTLDDYEEGTWTPGVSSLGNLTGTPSYQSTLYTKIGNKCFMEANVNGLSVTVANTRTNFTVNFPFSAVSAYAVTGTGVSNNASGLGGFLATNTASSTIYWETGTIIPSGVQSFQIGICITTA